MQVFIDRNSPLSFQTNTVIVQPLNEWQFEVQVNGIKVGYIITRNNDWGIDVKGHPFTNDDETLLINAANPLPSKIKHPKKHLTYFITL
jgi:hypothetical protein